MRDVVWFIWPVALIELVEALHEHKIVAARIAAPWRAHGSPRSRADAMPRRADVESTGDA